jgi:nucleotide-binding universal stress UspA family protein
MRILIPIDGTPGSLAAVDFVASRKTLVGRDPDVFVLHAQWPAPRNVVKVLGHGHLRTVQDRSAERVLKPALKKLVAAELLTQSISVIGHAGEEIARAAKKKHADLIVMASRGLSATRAFFFGSVTSTVLARSKTPVLILRSHQAPKRLSLRIGIAVDGSKYGMAAIRYVLKHRFLFGPQPEIKLIHVAPQLLTYVPDIGAAMLPPPSPADLQAMQENAFENAVGRARDLLRSAGMEFEEVKLIGNPGDEIASFARSHRLDVLVMGSHGRGAFASGLLGSVATRVAAMCRTPLLLIRRS